MSSTNYYCIGLEGITTSSLTKKSSTLNYSLDILRGSYCCCYCYCYCWCYWGLMNLTLSPSVTYLHRSFIYFVRSYNLLEPPLSILTFFLILDSSLLSSSSLYVGNSCLSARGRRFWRYSTHLYISS